MSDLGTPELPHGQSEKANPHEDAGAKEDATIIDPQPASLPIPDPDKAHSVIDEHVDKVAQDTEVAEPVKLGTPAASIDTKDNNRDQAATNPSDTMEKPEQTDAVPGKQVTEAISPQHTATDTSAKRASSPPSAAAEVPTIPQLPSDAIKTAAAATPSTSSVTRAQTVGSAAAPAPRQASPRRNAAPSAGIADITGPPVPKASAIIPSTSTLNTSRRSITPRVSVEAHAKARQDEIRRLQKENEDMRLMWLSLPANDHITYYSDTDDDNNSSAGENGNARAPMGTYGGMPYLPGYTATMPSRKRKKISRAKEEERESSDSLDEDDYMQGLQVEKQYSTGNRGNKLRRDARWVRKGKLGLWTEAKNEKEVHDRFAKRVKSIQRAGIESLLSNAPGPKVIQSSEARQRDMLSGSDRLLLRDCSMPMWEKKLHSTSLAPALLRPILTARALLESHALRHTFRNPHIGALSKTALDLRESEGLLSRALGGCLSAMERIHTNLPGDKMNGGGLPLSNGNHSQENDGIDPHAIGVEGTSCTSDELNPAFAHLDRLFITKEGLPIPMTNSGSEAEAMAQEEDVPQTILSVAQQRDVVRASLECLNELGSDSLEYVERLDEVRGRLEAVKKRRTQVWEALRMWAIRQEVGPDPVEEEIEESEAIEEVAAAAAVAGAARGNVKTAATTSGTARKRK